MSRLSVGVMLRPGADGDAAGIPEQARRAEALGFDGVFIGDHLRAAQPYPDALVALAAAAAATRRVRLGFAVMVLALRDTVWTAKQLAALQQVSHDRVMLGVGTGGRVHGTEAWDAVGVPFAARGRATDAALALLPPLIRGERVTLPSGAAIALAPPATMPPLLIGGNSAAALRRAARHAAGWLPSMLTPERVREGARQLADGTDIVVGAATLLGGDVADGRLAAFARSLTQGYGIHPDQAERVPIAGGPAQAAERLAAYADAGASWVVVGTIDADWHREWERVAEARALVH